MSLFTSNNGLPEKLPEKEPKPALSDFQMIEQAAQKLEGQVTEALKREGKLNQFKEKKESKEVNLLAQDVVNNDVSRAETEVERVQKKLTRINEAAVVLNMEMPGDVDMKLEFNDQEDLINFLVQYKQAAGENAA